MSGSTQAETPMGSASSAETPMGSTSSKGRAGEDAAARYLESLGYRILRRNVRGPSGEIDILARDGNVLVFVEVKARARRTFGSALGAVDARKRARIRALAADYLQYLPPQTKVRFDVVAFDAGRIAHHQAAFA
jgi:putative endonuclease